MADKQPTKRTLLLRLRAARAMEKGLPDQVRRAYGDAPSVLADLPSDDPHLATVRENARSSLLKQGYLTEEDLDTLPVDEAIATAQQRLRAQGRRPARTIRHAGTPREGQPGPGHEGAPFIAARIGVAWVSSSAEVEQFRAPRHDRFRRADDHPLAR